MYKKLVNICAGFGLAFGICFGASKYKEYSIEQSIYSTLSKCMDIKIVADETTMPLNLARYKFQVLNKILTQYDKQTNVNIVLTTSGGPFDDSMALANKLKLFNKVRIFVPFYAYSVGSMLAVTADKLYMTKLSTINPVCRAVALCEIQYDNGHYMVLKVNPKIKEKVA